MAEKNYGNNSQLAELMKYISDKMKFPIMGAGGGFAPIGTLNFFDASVAPNGWLACDGTVYNISDYPDLATYYASVHGASNFYGGNGTTTFAVPDLRGEFLRGTGTNSHENQGSGANVGVHQDGTQHISISTSSDTVFGYSGSGETTEQNKDSVIGNKSGKYTGTSNTSSMYTTYYTSRPTNTSFLICVKATVAGDPNGHVYSTEEQVVAQDENGNDVYEMTINGTTPSASGAASISVGNNVSKCRIVEGYATESGGFNMPNGYSGSGDEFNVAVKDDGTSLYFAISSGFQSKPYRIVVRYIKTS